MVKNKFLWQISQILLALLLTSCGATSEEEREHAILQANIFLNKSRCQEAIDVLEGAGRDNRHAQYLQVLASAYACRAGFREPAFFTTNIAKSATPAPLGGTSTYSTSASMDAPDNDDFDDLQVAIDILLYAGGIPTSKDPTPARRADSFNTDEAGNINAQLLYMLMAQIGKYFYYYGNADVNGVKGLGTGSNVCFVSYENVALDVGGDLSTVLLAAAGTCPNSSAAGHSKLGSVAGGDLQIARLCQGVVLINNFLTIFPVVLSDVGGDTDLDILNTINTAISPLKIVLTAAKTGIGNILETLGQERCVAENTTNDDFLQVYFALFIELLIL